MPKLYKLVVTGPFNAGKTTFVNTLSQFEAVNTDRATSHKREAALKPSTTVAMDYGRVKLNGSANVHLFGTPGQERFEFMCDLLADGMHGFIFLVDSTDDGSLTSARKMLSLFQKRGNVPYLLAANKADQKNGLKQEEIRKRLKLSPQQPIVPCVATKRSSVQTIVEQLVSMIEAGV